MNKNKTHINLAGISCFCRHILQYCFKQLIFTVLLFKSLCSLSQEYNTTTFYIHSETIIEGLNYIEHNLKTQQDSLYIIENTVFFSNQELAIVVVEDSFNTSVAEHHEKIISSNVAITTKKDSHAKSCLQVEQGSLPFPLPVKHKLIITTCTCASSVYSNVNCFKKIDKAYTKNTYCLATKYKKHESYQDIIIYNKNCKSFEVKLIQSNKAPPFCS